MFNASFTDVENDVICCGCGSIINAGEPAFMLFQDEPHLNNIDVVMCDDCGRSVMNDMSNEYHYYFVLRP